MKLKTSIALTGFVAAFALLALTPAGASLVNTNNADSPVLFGMAEMTLKNGDGDVLASQTVHNTLVNYGEAILINGAFGTVAANEQPHVICIAEDLEATILEDSTAAQFERLASFSTGNTCIVATLNVNGTGVTDDTSSRAIMNATFSSTDGDNNIIAGQAINSLAICNSINDAADLVDCQSTGALFSAVGVDETTVGASDTVEVTYTFDLTSDDD